MTRISTSQSSSPLMPRLLRRGIRHDPSTRTNKPRTHSLPSDSETDSRRPDQSVLRTRVWRRQYSCPFGRTHDVAALVADLQPAADSGTGFRTGSVAASPETCASTDVRLQEGCSARCVFASRFTWLCRPTRFRIV